MDGTVMVTLPIAEGPVRECPVLPVPTTPAHVQRAVALVRVGEGGQGAGRTRAGIPGNAAGERAKPGSQREDPEISARTWRRQMTADGPGRDELECAV